MMDENQTEAAENQQQLDSDEQKIPENHLQDIPPTDGHRSKHLSTRLAGHFKRNILIISFIILNLAMGSVSTALLVKKPAPQVTKAAANNTVSSKTVAANQNPASITDTPETKLEHYKSEPLNLEFDYPIDWHIDSDSSNKIITISSPTTDIVSQDGRAAKSSVEISIVPKYDGGQYNLIDDSLVISANSEAITYSNPTDVQRKTTNISFTRYSEDPADSISNIFVSGNLAYSIGKTTNTMNYKAVNPFITMYVNSCPNSGCQALSINRISIDTFHTNPILIKAKAIIQSMRFN